VTPPSVCVVAAVLMLGVLVVTPFVAASSRTGPLLQETATAGTGAITTATGEPAAPVAATSAPADGTTGSTSGQSETGALPTTGSMGGAWVPLLLTGVVLIVAGLTTVRVFTHWRRSYGKR
jgi:hypothetical protein